MVADDWGTALNPRIHLKTSPDSTLDTTQTECNNELRGTRAVSFWTASRCVCSIKHATTLLVAFQTSCRGILQLSQGRSSFAWRRLDLIRTSDDTTSRHWHELACMFCHPQRENKYFYGNTSILLPINNTCSHKLHRKRVLWIVVIRVRTPCHVSNASKNVIHASSG